ncbi:MerR family transcriptional regulator [Ramlibacter aurantiacus]|uniref:MerR family transcriptional regulator n=1 Tax=Ramlibacter aurantiacus TaxID=2801330 RepID=UPI001F368C92|nr:MerR family transcriptional regulator [Ramlibacter aurantiacus]
MSISAVEREVGLSKDVLRVWERRYGFPVPSRDAHGERTYSAEQVHRLRHIKRLMDGGWRPGRLFAMAPDDLQALLKQPSAAVAEVDEAATAQLEPLLAAVRAHDLAGFERAMQQRLAQQGLARLVLDTVGPVAVWLGQEWEHGRLQVFEEHLFTELLARLLRRAIAAVPAGQWPRVLLTTVPDEPHGLGLLMLEAMLTLEGADCVSLGTQTPLLEIAQAAQVQGAQLVALSFSGAFPSRQVAPLLQQLRKLLPGTIALWAGGAGVRRTPAPEGVSLLGSLDDAVAALATLPRRAAG